MKHTNNTASWRYLWRVALSFIVMIVLLDLLWLSLIKPSPDQFWQTAYWQSLEQSPNASATLPSGLVIYDEPLDNLHLESIESARLASPNTVLINGKAYLIKVYPDQNRQIRIGPIPKQNTFYSTAFTALFYLLLALLLWLWIRPIVKGLDQLSQTAQKFAQDYSAPLPSIDTPSPVKEMVTSFESMALQIRQLIQTQAELTSALSHELRTPLARIKFALANARSGHQLEQQLQSIDIDVNELEQLISTMLDYCRLDQSQPLAHNQTVELSAVLPHLVEKYQWRSPANIHIKTTLHDCFCDQRLMTLALSNLIANASRYAKHQIHIRYWRDDGHQHFCVEDDGIGIKVQDQQRAVQAFSKLNTHASSEGFGLGLAIVNRVCLLHHGQLTLAQAPKLSGLQVTISWPIR